METELWQLLPDVCQFLAEVDAIHSTRLVQYMRLLSDRSFPMTNISLVVNTVFFGPRSMTFVVGPFTDEVPSKGHAILGYMQNPFPYPNA